MKRILEFNFKIFSICCMFECIYFVSNAAVVREGNNLPDTLLQSFSNNIQLNSSSKDDNFFSLFDDLSKAIKLGLKQSNYSSKKHALSPPSSSHQSFSGLYPTTLKSSSSSIATTTAKPNILNNLLANTTIVLRSTILDTSLKNHSQLLSRQQLINSSPSTSLSFYGSKNDLSLLKTVISWFEMQYKKVNSALTLLMSLFIPTKVVRSTNIAQPRLEVVEEEVFGRVINKRSIQQNSSLLSQRQLNDQTNCSLQAQQPSESECKQAEAIVNRNLYHDLPESEESLLDACRNIDFLLKSCWKPPATKASSGEEFDMLYEAQKSSSSTATTGKSRYIKQNEFCGKFKPGIADSVLNHVHWMQVSLCSNEKFRKEFIEYLPCLKRWSKSHAQKVCSREYSLIEQKLNPSLASQQQKQKYIEQDTTTSLNKKQTDANNYFKTLCCDRVTGDCGPKARQFLVKYISTMGGEDIRGTCNSKSGRNMSIILEDNHYIDPNYCKDKDVAKSLGFQYNQDQYYNSQQNHSLMRHSNSNTNTSFISTPNAYATLQLPIYPCYPRKGNITAPNDVISGSGPDTYISDDNENDNDNYSANNSCKQYTFFTPIFSLSLVIIMSLCLLFTVV